MSTIDDLFNEVIETVNTCDERKWAGRIEFGGGAYRFIVWHEKRPIGHGGYNGQWFAAFPDFGKAARIGFHVHWDYVAEKFDMSRPDAEVAATIINACQHLGGTP